MKKTSLYLFSFVGAIVLLLGVGCAKKLDDAKMSSDIQTKFSQDSGLSTKQLTVQANDGVVTISGNVENEAQRDAAARYAASIPGVKTVVNNLQIGDAGAMMAAAPPATVQATPPTEQKPMLGSSQKSEKAHKRAATKSLGNPAPENQELHDQQTAANETPADSAPAPDDSTPPPPPPPPAPKKLIIDQGTQLTVRLIDPIDSEKNQVGDTFHATLNSPLSSDGEQAVPAGVELTGHLVDVKSASKFAGQSVIVMQLDTLSAGGQKYSLQTDQYRNETKARGKNTAEKVGGGAVLGGIIGALAGGGKGAAIGSVAGAGVGAGAQAASKSQQIKLPSETVLTFTLQAPITVIQAAPTDSNRPKLGDSQ